MATPFSGILLANSSILKPADFMPVACYGLDTGKIDEEGYGAGRYGRPLNGDVMSKL